MTSKEGGKNFCHWKFTSTNHKYYLLFEIFEWGYFHIIFNNDNDDGNKNFYHET